MPQVSNLSWLYSSSLCLLLFSTIILSINYLSLFSFCKIQISSISCSKFFFLV